MRGRLCGGSSSSLLLPIISASLLFGCAAAPKPIAVEPSVDLADEECERLRQTVLEQPIRTPIAEARRAVGEALQTGDAPRALALARELAEACRGEAQQRIDVAALRRDLQERGRGVSLRHQAHFEALIRARDYGNAIVCGEGLLQGVPERCDETMVAGVERPYRSRETVTLERQRAPYPSRRRQPQAVEPVRQERKVVLSTSESAGEPSVDQSPASARRATRPAPAGTTHGRRSKLWFWGTAGASLALLASGAVLAGLASARHADLEQRCPDCSEGEVDGGKRMALAADVMLGLGLAAGIGAAVLWFVRPGESAAAREAPQRVSRSKVLPETVSLGPTGAAARWAF